ncbi:MAG TPA: cupin-like domain-containing protein, partial [Polyangiaceae bacterium]|nr:cupin-like domain-containing protein [Polyangiaceae bacterium]
MVSAAEIERIEGPTPAEFRRRYLATGTPVVLGGVADRWPAAAWTPEYFRRSFAEIETTSEAWDRDEGANDPLDFIAKQRRTAESVRTFVEKMGGAEGARRKPYCAEWRVFEAIPQLRKAVGSLAPFMGLSPPWPAPIGRLLQLEPLLWMGPGGVVSPLHFDRAHNFFVQLYGRKKWILVAPEESDNVYYPCADFPLSRLHMSPVDVEHPDLERFPKFRRVRRYELVLGPGDILFIPAGWWHYVRALDASISMNFFWLKPFGVALALRRHAYYSLRRRLLTGARLDRFSR